MGEGELSQKWTRVDMGRGYDNHSKNNSSSTIAFYKIVQ